MVRGGAVAFLARLRLVRGPLREQLRVGGAALFRVFTTSAP
ncbi:hypothetical protein [Deinococcus aerophilus]|nr:hypothetical protein [Deinococcus aerophilus]